MRVALLMSKPSSGNRRQFVWMSALRRVKYDLYMYCISSAIYGNELQVLEKG